MSASASTPLIIGSRGSELALWQANFIQARLKSIGVLASIKIIKTQGDKILNLSFDKLEGKGFFTKEIEEALLANEIDIAVHSHKDLPTENPKGLIVAAVSYREDPSELLLMHKDAVASNLPLGLKKNAVVGTSSARRKSQLLAFRDDLGLKDLRGNVQTRIQKLRDRHYDAIMLAVAGVERLGTNLSEFHCQKLSPTFFVPAPAQGVLALQIRENDSKVFDLLQQLNDRDVADAIRIERKVLNLFDGGCQLPLGVYCEKQGEEEDVVYKVWASKASTWDAFPIQLYMESRKAFGLAEKIVEKINNFKPSSVFISRDLRPNGYLDKSLLKQGFQVHACALIEIKQVPIVKLAKSDWVFFSSKNAVRHFFEQQPLLDQVKYGVVGKSTAEELRKYGKKADFIGYSTDTKLTGKQFASVVGSQTVLFPQAKGSRKTIQQQFTKPTQVIDLPVYETLKPTGSGTAFDPTLFNILVFTSPSNVEAWFESRKIAANQKVIAMGDATASALKNFGSSVHAMPPSFDDVGLIQAIMSV